MRYKPPHISPISCSATWMGNDMLIVDIVIHAFYTKKFQVKLGKGLTWRSYIWLQLYYLWNELQTYNLRMWTEQQSHIVRWPLLSNLQCIKGRILVTERKKIENLVKQVANDFNIHLIQILFINAISKISSCTSTEILSTNACTASRNVHVHHTTLQWLWSVTL